MSTGEAGGGHANAGFAERAGSQPRPPEMGKRTYGGSVP